MTTLIAFLVAIVVLVAFHEYGHYLVARLCGVKVLRFSIGFGKVIYSRKFNGGETEWALSSIPLGGYVKMLDEREGEVAAEEAHRAFNRQPVLKRMAIVVAGPLANLLLAIVLYWALFIYGVPGLKPILGEIAPATPAASAELHRQQTIISVNGTLTPTWQEVRWILMDVILQGARAELQLRSVEGEVQIRELNVSSLSAADLDGDFLGKLGLVPYRPLVLPVIGQVLPGGVAEKVGLQVNDKLLRANGEAVTEWAQWVEIVRSHPAKKLQMDIERAGSQLSIELIPEAVREDGKEIGKIGAAPLVNEQEFERLMTTVSYGPLQAMGQAVQKTWETSIVSLKMMWRMVLGQVSLKNLSGPVTIADYAGQSAKIGMGSYIAFLALISISLGVLNLLPVPLLDGGHLLYYAIELIKGSPVSELAWEYGQKIGMALLFTLMSLALFNDFSRLLN